MSNTDALNQARNLHAQMHVREREILAGDSSACQPFLAAAQKFAATVQGLSSADRKQLHDQAKQQYPELYNPAGAAYRDQAFDNVCTPK